MGVRVHGFYFFLRVADRLYRAGPVTPWRGSQAKEDTSRGAGHTDDPSLDKAARDAAKVFCGWLWEGDISPGHADAGRHAGH